MRNYRNMPLHDLLMSPFLSTFTTEKCLALFMLQQQQHQQQQLVPFLLMAVSLRLFAAAAAGGAAVCFVYVYWLQRILTFAAGRCLPRVLCVSALQQQRDSSSRSFCCCCWSGYTPQNA